MAGPSVVSFATTSQQFCSFQVVLPAEGPPSLRFQPAQPELLLDRRRRRRAGGPAQQRPGPPPAGQNCAEAVHSG